MKISLSGDGDDLRAGYEAAVALGFRSFKVKVGRDPEADVARVALARELAGEAALVGADANGAGRCPSRSQPCRASPSRGSTSSSSRSTRTTSRVCATYAGSACRSSPTSRCTRRRTFGGSGGSARRTWSASTSARAGARTRGRVRAACRRARDGRRHRRERRDGHRRAAQLHVACACERLGEIPHGIIGHHFYEEDRSLSEPSRSTASSLGCPRGLGVEPSDEVRRRFSA